MFREGEGEGVYCLAPFYVFTSTSRPTANIFAYARKMDLSKYYNSEVLSDCFIELKTNGEIAERLFSHTFILSKSSTIFYTAIQMQESKTPVVAVEVEDIASFKDLLLFFYTHDLKHIEDNKQLTVLRLMALADRFDSPMCFNAALSSPAFWTTDLAESPELFLQIINTKFPHMPRWDDIIFKALDDFANKLCEVLPPHAMWDTYKTLTQEEYGKQVLVHLSHKRGGLLQKQRTSFNQDKIVKIDKTLKLATLYYLTPDMLLDTHKLVSFVEWTSAVSKLNVFQDKNENADTQYIYLGLIRRFLHTSPIKKCSRSQANDMSLQYYNFERNLEENFGNNAILDWCKTMGVVETAQAVKRPNANDDLRVAALASLQALKKRA
jgi:hypothetical protein